MDKLYKSFLKRKSSKQKLIKNYYNMVPKSMVNQVNNSLRYILHCSEDIEKFILKDVRQLCIDYNLRFSELENYNNLIPKKAVEEINYFLEVRDPDAELYVVSKEEQLSGKRLTLEESNAPTIVFAVNKTKHIISDMAITHKKMLRDDAILTPVTKWGKGSERLHRFSGWVNKDVRNTKILTSLVIYTLLMGGIYFTFADEITGSISDFILFLFLLSSVTGAVFSSDPKFVPTKDCWQYSRTTLNN